MGRESANKWNALELQMIKKLEIQACFQNPNVMYSMNVHDKTQQTSKTKTHYK